MHHYHHHHILTKDMEKYFIESNIFLVNKWILQMRIIATAKNKS